MVDARMPWHHQVGHDDQVAGARVIRVEDGSGDGARLVEVWTPGGLQADLLLDRALDVHAVRVGGRSVAWIGPPGLARRHAYEPAGFGWLRTFHGGLVVTCGLEHFGGPAARSAAEYAPPDERQIELGEHGRISHQAAALLRCEVVRGVDPAIVVTGEVTQAALYAEQFRLRRTYRFLLDDPEIELTDEVTNVGSLPTRQVIVYHMNFGYPLVDERTGLNMETAAGPMRAEYGPLGPATPEQVDRVELARDRAGWAHASIVNPAVGLSAHLAFDAATLPAFFIWKLARMRANVLGLNPASDWNSAEASPLEPGSTRTYRWRLRFPASS